MLTRACTSYFHGYLLILALVDRVEGFVKLPFQTRLGSGRYSKDNQLQQKHTTPLSKPTHLWLCRTQQKPSELAIDVGARDDLLDEENSSSSNERVVYGKSP